MNYSKLTDLQQKQLITKIALEILSQSYSMKIDKIKCFHHGYNTTFKVGSGRADYAFRLAISTPRKIPEMRAEHEWLSQLAKSSLAVPRLVENKMGETLSISYSQDLKKRIPATLMKWEKGILFKKLGVQKRISYFQELGRAMALLHFEGRKFKSSRTSQMQELRGVFWSRRNKLKWLSKTHPKLMTASVQSELADYLESSKSIIEPYWNEKSLIPVHADLHFGNLLAEGQKIKILDFDDCGLGYPALDLGVTLYYHSGERSFLRYVDQLLEGYSRRSPLPFKDPKDLRWMIIARGLLLLNAVLDMKTSSIQKNLPQIFERNLERMRRVCKIKNQMF